MKRKDLKVNSRRYYHLPPVRPSYFFKSFALLAPSRMVWLYCCLNRCKRTINFYLMDERINTKKKIVLVADDDDDLLQLVKMQLQQAGFAVQLSLNGYGIIKMAVDGHPDIILLDIAMDGISGGDICKKLKMHDETSR